MRSHDFSFPHEKCLKIRQNEVVTIKLHPWINVLSKSILSLLKTPRRGPDCIMSSYLPTSFWQSLKLTAVFKSQRPGWFFFFARRISNTAQLWTIITQDVATDTKTRQSWSEATTPPREARSVKNVKKPQTWCECHTRVYLQISDEFEYNDQCIVTFWGLMNFKRPTWMR